MSSVSDSDMEIECTPPEIIKAAKSATTNLLPDKSKALYMSTYKTFMDWRSIKQIDSFSERVLLVYFDELSTKYKPSTLWTTYSMLRSTLDINHSVNIETYAKLRALLKRKSHGFHAKKAAIFTPEEVNRFLNNAEDAKYLATKVALIMGIMGACRGIELYSMKLADVKDLGSALLVTIPQTKTGVSRKFMITDKFYEICKKYIDLRGRVTKLDSLFLSYQNGKCTAQKTGKNKFTAMGRNIASYLQLPNPEKYSGHSFRRSSATMLVDAGGDITALKRHGGWKSSTVAESYIDESMTNKCTTAEKLSNSIQGTQKLVENIQNISTVSTHNFDINPTPHINFNNCSNVNVTINNYK